MTLGRKIRYARKRSGLSQEQLAQKLCVSRSAIAKWETDKGMPDVENLKLLAKLLHASLDSLLSDSNDTAAPLLQEAYHLSALGSGCRRVKKDRLMRQRFADAQVYPLLARPLLTGQDPPEGTLGFLTPIPFGTPQYLKSLKDLPLSFYLVEQDGAQLFVTVTDTALQIRPLGQSITEKTFCLDNWQFIRCQRL